MLFKCFYLIFSLIFNCFYLFFKCFTKRRICKFSLFCYCNLIDGNISSPVRYFIIFYSTLADDNADIFVGSVLLLYCTFSSLILSSMVMINFYIHSKIFFLKREELSNGRVVSITKKEYVFVVHFL